MMKINHKYLIETVSYGSYHTILEVKCVDISKTAYKLLFIQADNVKWLDKKEFVNKTAWGADGYFVREDLGSTENTIATPALPL